MAYDNPTTVGYRFPAAAIANAGTVGRLTGPAGMKGRVVDIAHVTTTATTAAATAITVGVSGNTGKYANNSIPVEAVNSVGNGVNHVADVEADTAVLVTSDGGCTAGAADLLVTIDWFK